MYLAPAFAGVGEMPASWRGRSFAAGRGTIRRGIRWNALLPIVAVVLCATALPMGRAFARTEMNVVKSGALVNVVVRAVPGAPGVERAITSVGGQIERRIGIIDAYAVRVHEGALAALRAIPTIASVTDDARLQLAGASYAPEKDPYSLFQTQQDFGVRAMWQKHYTGDNVDVALVDSGVSPVAGLDEPGKVIYGPDLTEESQNPATANLDTFGHGTFMAGIIAGHDDGFDAVKAAGDKNPFMGYAPDARIVSVKVADAQGATDVSQVLAGIDWVVQHAHDSSLNIRVLNLSFGTDASQPYTLDPLAYATEVAWKAGITVVVSAGNTGSSLGHLTLPAYDPFVLAVGAVDIRATSIDGAIPDFSARGDGVRNPDVVFPGVHVQSLRVQGSYIDQQFGDTGVINDRFFRGSGTSEAAAAASGTAALLIDEYSNIAPDDLKALLKNTSAKIPGVDATAQGSGVVNLRKTMTTKPPRSPQSFTPSTGTGSIDASRGSAQISVNGVALTGEKDIMGTPIDTTALAAAEASGTAWSGGVWNGVRWSGDDWSGVRWSGATWTGNDWSGVRWSSDTWSTGTWDGVRWSNTNWDGVRWSGVRWSGVRWSGVRWSGDVWSGRDWS